MSGRTRVSQEPELPNPYEPFVREVLTRLATNLNSGRLNLRHDAAAQRYVVEAPGHSGRNIVVPCAPEALRAPSTLPARTARGLLSDLKLVSANGKEVDVPKSAIVRNHCYTVACDPYTAPPCRGCEHGTCPHGWSADAVRPEAIVVLQLRDEDNLPIFGWYVCFWDRPTQLVRMPERIIEQLANAFYEDDRIRNSSLVTQYEDCTTVGLDDNFHEMACKRFARFRKRAAAAALKDSKRKRDDSEAAGDGVYETCVICLEEKQTAIKRCRHDHCGTHVCMKCHSDSRGLCPVCDRSSINADYPCSSCHRLVRLCEYGFPCTGCAAHSLCTHCYKGFSECGACESA